MAAAVVLFAAACSASGSDQSRSSSVSGSSMTHKAPATEELCPPSAGRVPSCGRFFGISIGPDSGHDVDGLERLVERQFDIVYEFHGIDKPLPARGEARMVREGRILYVNVEAKEFAKRAKPIVSWARITAGEFDDALRQQAIGLASLKAPVLVTFDHEADSPRKVGVRGTAAEFVAAWRHIHDVYVAAGATNVVWVWVVTGYEENWPSVPGLYPGNEYVDWLGWDVYNRAGCKGSQVKAEQWQSFQEMVQPFYTWLEDNGPWIGIDISKPFMLSEFGTVAHPSDAAETANWYTDIPTALSQFPRLRALQLWNGRTTDFCDYRIEHQPDAITALTDVMSAPTFAGLAK
jgi:hypothetical protein